MITYVDTSSLLKLVVDAAGSERAELVWTAAEAVASARLVVVESHAALAAAARAHRLSGTQHRDAKHDLAELLDDLALVEVTAELIDAAALLAEEEGLRGDDAVHLAAALQVGATVVSSADDQLCGAAARRGLHVANPLER